MIFPRIPSASKFVFLKIDIDISFFIAIDINYDHLKITLYPFLSSYFDQSCTNA